MIHVQSKVGIRHMRECGRINAMVHERLRHNLVPGISTLELDSLAAETIRELGAKSSIREPFGFPGDISISVNDQIGHGIPGSYELCMDDLVKVDISIEYLGYHTDCAVTHVIGPGTPSSQRLMKVTEEALHAGIAKAVVGGRCSDISAAVYDAVRRHGYEIIRHASGHGIGRELHEDPSVVNFGPKGFGPRLREGMVLAIEPVTSAGSRFSHRAENGWTDVTVDGSLSAHFEHTVAITAEGPEILTRLEDTSSEALWRGETPVAERNIDLGVSFRPMRESEQFELLQMATREMDPILMEAWGRRVNPGEIFQTSGRVVVAEDRKGRVVGFFVAMEQNDAMHVNTLVVDGSSQGQGVGKAAMEHCETIAKSCGLDSMTLCVQTNNVRAIRFYHRLGYKSVRPVHPNSILMSKELVPDS